MDWGGARGRSKGNLEGDGKGGRKRRNPGERQVQGWGSGLAQVQDLLKCPSSLRMLGNVNGRILTLQRLGRHQLGWSIHKR